jgi:hypothetical protein
MAEGKTTFNYLKEKNRKYEKTNANIFTCLRLGICSRRYENGSHFRLFESAFGDVRDDFSPARMSLAFSATTQSEGATSGPQDNIVTGQAEYHNVDVNGENTRLHVEVNCLNIGPDGITATISGVVKTASDPNAVGATAIFRVRDGGEGNNNDADGITQVFTIAPDLNRNCFTITGIQPMPIRAGNVQVKP